MIRGGLHRRPLRGRKGQAATEYLHTYGWVFLTFIVLGGLLLYYNVSRAEVLLPLECTFLSGLNCLDMSVEENRLSIAVVNEFGFAVSNISMQMNGTCNMTANTTEGNPFGNLAVLVENKQADYVFECPFNISNMKLTERITVEYRNVETDQAHVKVGKLQYSPGD